MAALDVFLGTLTQKQITLEVLGERLRFTAPKGVMTEGMITELRKHKPAILSHYYSTLSDYRPNMRPYYFN